MNDPVDDQIAAAVEAVRASIPVADNLGIYLYGSAVAGGLKPDSDLDLLVVTSRRLTRDEKRGLIDRLMPISGRATRSPDWRPLEVTVVAQSDIRPWKYPPLMDLQYGEWLRERFLADDVSLAPSASPDLAVVVTMVRESGRAIEGPPPRELLDPVPSGDLIRAMTDELPALLDDLEQDTRNVTLTFARVWVTTVTGRIMSKTDAAEWAIGRLAPEVSEPLARARDLYVGGGLGSWDDRQAARRTVTAMRYEIDRLVGEHR
ncbi:MAG: aminoglycoside adenylyltransferase family protein [Acidimicrobiia bacterium]